MSQSTSPSGMDPYRTILSPFDPPIEPPPSKPEPEPYISKKFWEFLLERAEEDGSDYFRIREWLDDAMLNYDEKNGWI